MERNQVIQMREKMVDLFEKNGVVCKWKNETGTIVMKRNGEVKISFSLRDEQTYKNDVVKMKELVSKEFPELSVKYTNSNQMSTFRPEYRLILTI